MPSSMPSSMHRLLIINMSIFSLFMSVSLTSKMNTIQTFMDETIYSVDCQSVPDMFNQLKHEIPSILICLTLTVLMYNAKRHKLSHYIMLTLIIYVLSAQIKTVSSKGRPQRPTPKPKPTPYPTQYPTQPTTMYPTTFDNIIYDGPASVDYFRQHFSMNVSDLPELKCGTELNGETNAVNPVMYYRFEISKDKSINYKSMLNIQTCCDFEGVESGIESVWKRDTGNYRPWHKYEEYCGTESLDTVLYVLYHKKGKINLIDTSDDVPSEQCKQPGKSRIDLIGLNEGEYIVAVGGYGTELGTYFIQFECEQYSYPAKSDQLNPSLYNLGAISCGTTINGSMFDTAKNITQYVAYYEFNVTETNYLPITITACIDHNMAKGYIIKNLYGDVYEIYETTQVRTLYLPKVNAANARKVLARRMKRNRDQFMRDYMQATYGWCLWKQGFVIRMRDTTKYNDIIDDSTNERRNRRGGEYYFALQWSNKASNGHDDVDRGSKGPPQFQVKIDCAAEPTLPPTSLPTTSPTKGPTDTPTIDPTGGPTSNPTKAPSMEPTGDPTKHPTEDPTIEPTSDPTTDPTIDPTRDPTIDPTANPTKNPSIAPTRSPTLEYSFPIHKVEYQSHLEDTNELLTIPLIICGDILLNQQNTAETLVSYYKFSVTDNMYTPSVITTCPQDKNELDFNITAYNAVLYILHSLDEMVLPRSESAKCNKESAEIDVSSFENGDYFAVVQGDDNEIGNFSISMICTDPPPEISKELMMGIVFGSCGVLLFLLFAYYIYEWSAYCKNRNIYCYSGRYGSSSSSSFASIPQNEDEEDEEKEDIYSDQEKEDGEERKQHNWCYYCCLCCFVEFEKNENEIIDEKELKIDARRIDADQSLTEQLTNNEKDVVQLAISHAIQCCDDQEGMDIYQMLAIRFFDKDSREIRGRKPFKKIGINFEFVAISPFFQTVIITLIVGAAQFMGTTVVIYKLLKSFFADGITEDICIMDAERWKMVWSLKILSFLLSLIITFYVSIIMSSLQHSGMYEIMDRLTSKHMQRIDGVVLWILQIGQGINYYVCLLAVIGSYFIIWESNGGEESDDGSGFIDYSHSGLDMILNAVALFFLLELDDVMISPQDYNDCKQHLERIGKCYYPDIHINKQYIINHDEPIFDCHCCRKNDIGDITDNNNNDNKLDITNYKMWSNEDCVNWIISINKQFEKYQDKLKQIFVDNNYDGIYLLNVQKSDITSWGITDFNDKNIIYQEIRIHFKNNNSFCMKYMIPSNCMFLNVLSVFVKSCCYGFGFGAPFLIFFCW